MAEKSNIEWTDATWNPITGCSVVSPGCKHCYAMRLAGTRLARHPSRAGLTVDTKAGPVWNGKVRFNEEWLDQPLRWRRPRMIFVCAHGDLFAEGVPDEWIDRVFDVMAACSHHTFQVLTKRPERMREYCRDLPKRQADLACNAAADWIKLPLLNVWLGVSAEDQKRADERVPDLLATPAAIRFVSAEPLLGPVDLTRIEGDPSLDWVIVGGESGRDARPMHPDWARSIRDQCAAAHVPFFFKQWGEWALGSDFRRDAITVAADGTWWRSDQCVPSHVSNRWSELAPTMMHRAGKKRAGHLLDGREHREFPRGATGMAA